jgi:hypothetical protein
VNNYVSKMTDIDRHIKMSCKSTIAVRSTYSIDSSKCFALYAVDRLDVGMRLMIVMSADVFVENV